MNSLHPYHVLLLRDFPPSQTSNDFNYEEFLEIEANCNMLDSCNVPRSSDSLDKYTCQCESYCSRHNTCCMDSRYRDRETENKSLTCRPINGDQEKHYFMVDQCPSSNRDRALEKLCRDDWNNENNLLPLVPVTSVISNYTYKNFYCFRCNEATDNFLYWNIKLNSDVASESRSEREIVPFYDKERQTWTASIGKDGSYLPVELSFEIPQNMQNVSHICIPNAISSCSRNWRIKDIEGKCSNYTSYIFLVKYGTKIFYKNPHCALCNFESLEKMGCGVTTNRVQVKKPFSFTLLLDINRSDGDKVGKVKRCNSDSTWDPFFQKCKVYSCALPGYVVRNGKCTPP